MLTKKMTKTVLSDVLSNGITPSIITSAIISLLTVGRCRFTPGKMNHVISLKEILTNNCISFYERKVSSGIIIAICYIPESEAV